MPATPPLIDGPYHPPAVCRGDRVTCLLRDGDAVVTSWTAAPVPWPRCRAVGSRGGSGLLMTDELRRAVVTESAAALRYWFGASKGAVNHWRRWAGGEGRDRTEGSRVLHRRTSAMGAAAAKAREVTEHERRSRSERAKADGRTYPNRWPVPVWTPERDARLGTAPDADLAAALGLTRAAVRSRRNKLGIPLFQGLP